MAKLTAPELLIFDLDGTVVDSQTDLTRAVNLTRADYGLEALSVETVSGYLGSGIKILVDRVMPRESIKNAADIVQALEKFKNYYAAHILDTTKPYNGIMQILEKYQNKKKVILSNKSENFSKEIINKLELSKYFLEVWGGDTLDEKKPSPKPILELLKKFDVPAENAVMIGDGVNDILASRAAGVKSIATLYGYSNKNEIISLSPDFTVNTPSEITNIIA
jgi:phosphoglycolate phosphatase